jgi:O-methyltransferase
VDTQERMQFPSFDRGIHASIAQGHDYFRYVTLGLALQRVRNDEIPGAIAEVGVWRGDTSVFLHGLAPERKFFLFDTFEGFPQQDVAGEAEDERFRDTSLEAVRERLGPSPNVIITPGYVPETLEVAAEEKFAFVLLDLDLYAPTVGGLEFFYPRLSPGGYLILHDYNSPESEWANMRAFNEFLADKPEQVIELGDVWGSALIRRVKI